MKLQPAWISLFLVSLLLFTVTVTAQETAWQKVAPVGEEFTVSMPEPAMRTMRSVPFSEKLKLVVPAYESIGDGIRYIVLSVENKSPNREGPLASLIAFQSGFQAAIRNNNLPGVNQATLMRNFAYHGRAVQQYSLRMGAYSGLARIYEAEQHFYIVLALGADEHNPSVQRFMDSFTWGGTNTDRTATGVVSKEPEQKASSGAPPNPWPVDVPPSVNEPADIGVVNGRALEFPRPEYPQAARAAQVGGVVKVKVVIDEIGNVVSAEAVEGHTLLRDAAVAAARRARFTPIRLNGEPTKVTAVITYNFVPTKPPPVSN